MIDFFKRQPCREMQVVERRMQDDFVKWSPDVGLLQGALQGPLRAEGASVEGETDSQGLLAVASVPWLPLGYLTGWRVCSSVPMNPSSCWLPASPHGFALWKLQQPRPSVCETRSLTEGLPFSPVFFGQARQGSQNTWLTTASLNMLFYIFIICLILIFHD